MTLGDTRLFTQSDIALPSKLVLCIASANRFAMMSALLYGAIRQPPSICTFLGVRLVVTTCMPVLIASSNTSPCASLRVASARQSLLYRISSTPLRSNSPYSFTCLPIPYLSTSFFISLLLVPAPATSNCASVLYFCINSANALYKTSYPLSGIKMARQQIVNVLPSRGLRFL